MFKSPALDFRALDSGFNSENHSSVIGNDAPSCGGTYIYMTILYTEIQLGGFSNLATVKLLLYWQYICLN